MQSPIPVRIRSPSGRFPIGLFAVGSGLQDPANCASAGHRSRGRSGHSRRAAALWAHHPPAAQVRQRLETGGRRLRQALSELVRRRLRQSRQPATVRFH